MNDQILKHQIQANLQALGQGDFSAAALTLFKTLGYNTTRRAPFPEKTYPFFKESFLGAGSPFNENKALVDQWRSVDLLFQLSKAELSGQLGPFGTGRVENTIIESYLFMAIELAGADYSRTELAQITREVNKVFPMPVMVLFKQGGCVTLAVINRRLHKKDEQKDVLEKVTVIKDISLERPHRAHVEILFDLSLAQLRQDHPITNFVELHQAWQKTLDTKELNKRFYRELSNWYFWALAEVRFPAGNRSLSLSKGDATEKTHEHNAKNLIRLLTRLLFVWFVKEKHLIPDDLFDEWTVQQRLLHGFDPQSQHRAHDPAQGSRYYRAILQNLFFATLNQNVGQRAFRKAGQQRNVTNLMRYESYFKDPALFLRLVEERVPFMNGGLFECLDVPDATRKGPQGGDVILYEDGFSDRPENVLRVPDFLFFGGERKVDLSGELGDTRQKNVTVQGLIPILQGYKFTVAENTPIEEDVALDPELLGQVFENLLASYNPETQTTARKQTGSFYTPREIVNYMVDESLKAYLGQKLVDGAGMKLEDAAVGLELLLGYNEREHLFDEGETRVLIEAIDAAKILDPACGSGAFPMGILHKLVHSLHKLDPENERWREVQRQKAIKETEGAFHLVNKQERDERLQEISDVFEHNADDYGRKLYLIENCIYGVDIQPIATQISKLRFFISLIVDQRADGGRENFGVRPLPNLETKFVAANTLIGVEKPTAQMSLFDTGEIRKWEEQLKEVRHRLFSARTPAKKRQLREEDQRLREGMGELLVQRGWDMQTARQLAGWDPYDQNATAPFFDPEWMFGITAAPGVSSTGSETGGFDVVIGNPPYVRQEQIKALKPALQKRYSCYTGVADLYVYFFERGVQLLGPGGVLTYISSNKYFRAGYGEKLRQFLGQKTTVRQLIDFGDAPVFTAIAYPSIISLVKAMPNGHHTRALTWQPGPAIEEFEQVFAEQSFLLPQAELKGDGWRLESQTTLRLLDKLRGAGKPLGEYVNGRFYYGIKTGLNEAFVVDRATRDRLIAEHPSSAEVLKPFLRGRDVKRWRVDFAEQYLIKIESSGNMQHPWMGKREQEAEKIFARTYPAIYSWLDNFRDRLINRDDQGKYFWELRSCIYWEEFKQPKIVYPDIAQASEFTFDDNGYYLVNTLYLLPTDQTWLLGLLNSKAVFWFYTKISTQIRGGFVRFIAQYVSQIPIPPPPIPNPIEPLVAQILAAKKADPQADVRPLEAEIDRLVYQLYGLTAKEIAIVEGGG